MGRTKTAASIFAAATAAVAITAGSVLAGAPGPVTTRAFAVLSGTQASGISGMIYFRESSPGPIGSRVEIVADVHGPAATLAAGLHGLQIVSAGVCDTATGFTTSGSHLDLGASHSHAEHAGDLPNVSVSAGRGSMQTITTRVTLSAGPKSLFDDDGAAVILHLAADAGTSAGSDGGARIACGVIQAATASSLPFTGVQQNIPESLVTAAGFTLCYDGFYGDNGVPFGSIFGSCTGTEWVMACRPTGSSDLQLAAAANFADVTFDTGSGNETVTHNANGVEWYYNQDESWGFAAGGATVSKNSCDYDGTNPTPTDPDLRMCWHSPEAGYRCGVGSDNGGVYDNSFERMIYSR